METKYGRVYVLERETTAEGKEIINQRLLESVLFSNTDHKFYNKEKHLSPLYDEYKRKRFSIQVRINQKDKDGKQVEFEGKIMMPIRLGLLPPQDFESVTEETDKLLEAFTRFGAFSDDLENDEGYQALQNLLGSAMMASLCPGQKVSETEIFQWYCHAIYLVDEYCDKSTTQTDMPFKHSLTYWLAIADILEGKTHGDAVKKRIPSTLPKVFFVFIDLVQELRKKILIKGGNPKHCIRGITEFQESLILENSREWKQVEEDTESIMFRKTQEEIRWIVSGSGMVAHVLLYDIMLDIEESIRESFLFKYFFNMFVKHSTLVNDLLSLKKEMAGGTCCNAVYLVHVKDGLSLHDSFQKILEEINYLEKVFQETGGLLKKLYEENENVAEYVKVMTQFLYGVVQWHGITKRYHSDEMIYDCVIELD